MAQSEISPVALVQNPAFGSLLLGVSAVAFRQSAWAIFHYSRSFS